MQVEVLVWIKDKIRGRYLCMRHTVPKLTQDGNTMTEIFTFGSDRENIAPFVGAS